MFESFFGMGNPGNEARREEAMLDKQLNSSERSHIIGAATNADSEMVYQEQQKQREDLVRWQQDLEPELILFQHSLRNEWFNTEEGRWEKKIQIDIETKQEKFMEPLCNEFCIQKLTADLRPMLSKNLIMSNWQEDRLLRFLLTSINAITIDLGLYREEYGIKFNHTTSIINMIKNLVTPTFFRALGSGERKFLSTVNRRVETFSENQAAQPKKKGFFF